MYRTLMVDIVFAVFDVVPGDYRAEQTFSAFLTVYLILRKMEFPTELLLELKIALADLHRYRYLNNIKVIY